MLRETELLDTIHSELAIESDKTRDDESDPERLTTWILGNNEDRRLLIGAIEGDNSGPHLQSPQTSEDGFGALRSFNAARGNLVPRL